MQSKRLRSIWYRLWILGGIIWVFSSETLSEISDQYGWNCLAQILPDGVRTIAPDQQLRMERIELLKQTRNFLRNGSFIYAALGVVICWHLGETVGIGLMIVVLSWLPWFEDKSPDLGYDGGLRLKTVLNFAVFSVFSLPLWFFLIWSYRHRQSI